MDEPGQLIIPHDNEPKPGGDGAPEPERQPEPTMPPAPSPAPAPEPNAAAQSTLPPEPVPPVMPAVQPDPVNEGGWFHQEINDVATSQPELPPEGLQWTASEFIAHDKGTEWYAMLAGGGLVVAAIVYLLTKDIISTGVIVFAAITFGVFAGRKPQTQQYSLSGNGLQIGHKFYNLQDFKTFSVSMEGAIASIVLNPLKRFMPPLTLYVAPDLEETVMNFLSAYLPFEQHKADAVDSLLKRIRF